MSTLTFGAALDYLQRRFGGPLENTAVTVVTSPGVQRLLDFDSERVFVMIVNLSGSTFMIGFDGQTSATKGILLVASGGLLSFNVEQDAIMPCLPFFSFDAAAVGTFFVATVKRSTQRRLEDGG